jgi:dihydropteroate synthase
MGILNCTPDSFSDGGKFLDTGAAVEHALEMLEEGAEIIDIGGESTRPGSDPVPPDDQMKRTVPVIQKIVADSDTTISIDTQSADVADAAIAAGASIINDISSLRSDRRMADVAASSGAAVILMHMLGTPKSMQRSPVYEDVVREVGEFLRERIEFCGRAGIDRRSLVADPGIGFGKTVDHSLRLLARIADLQGLEVPILIGGSRKSFLGHVLDTDVEDRLEGSLAVVAWAAIQGVSIVRVHDVRATRRVIDTLAAVAANCE